MQESRTFQRLPQDRFHHLESGRRIGGGEGVGGWGGYCEVDDISAFEFCVEKLAAIWREIAAHTASATSDEKVSCFPLIRNSHRKSWFLSRFRKEKYPYFYMLVVNHPSHQGTTVIITDDANKKGKKEK